MQDFNVEYFHENTCSITDSDSKYTKPESRFVLLRSGIQCLRRLLVFLNLSHVFSIAENKNTIKLCGCWFKNKHRDVTTKVRGQ